jgi:hypothetical protein
MASESSGWIKKAIALLCIGGSVMAIYNVNSDNTELQKRAESEACGNDGCLQLIGMQRMPTSQEFTFQVQEGSSRTQKVDCSRAFLLFGEYTCVRK